MRRLLFGIAGLAVLGGAVATEAQQWSPSQLEVWGVVSKMNDHFYSGDIAGLYESIHPEAVWWNTQNDVPGDYESAKKFDTLFASHGSKWLYGSCTPLTIQVFDGVSVVNMYCRGLREGGSGKDPLWQTMRGHLVMKKEDGKWMLVSNFFDLTQR